MRKIAPVGIEEVLNAAVEASIHTGAIKPLEFLQVIVKSKVHEKTLTFLTNSHLIDVVQHNLVKSAKIAGIEFKQNFAK